MLNVLFTIINAALSMYLTSFLFRIFAPTKYEKSKLALAIAIATGMLTLVLLFISNFALKILFIVGISYFISMMYDIKWYNRILLSLVNYAIEGASEYLVLTMVSILFSVNLEVCYTGNLLVLGVLLSKIFIFLIESIILIRKHRIFHSFLNRKYYSIVLLPLANVCVVLLQYNLYISESILSNKLSLGDLICNSLLIATNIVAFNIIDEICNNAEKDAKLALVDKMLESQEKQYEELYNHNQAILKIKHDQKNFLLGVLADLETKKYSDIRNCVNRELEILSSPIVPATQNSMIYLIIKQKEEKSKTLGISLKCEYHELQKINISAIDLAIILGNALDNAIEATQNINDNIEKTISLLIKAQDDQIIIIIKNPVTDKVDVNNLISTKRSNFHGFGILSMKNLASVYGGEIIFTMENNIFQTCIILNNINE